ncbi:hypothetical protein IFM89_006708 [Coptis chinensis]|uniref:Membrane-associated kinase regulator 4 n=1 Tax=Coptis chinensis TaxID=261450 RepID=A0A835HCT0_9MAGN|nr:hypothetical protein IFM89_006708 [Coptis chinensis]
MESAQPTCDIPSTSCDNADEDYIDIEVNSTYLCYTINSTSYPREFEFHMCSNSTEREPSTSPADELFYKGNLLPLHLPPRLQMVQNLLQNAANITCMNKSEQNCSTPFTTSTPFESFNNSPTASRRVSGELNSGELFYECSTDMSSSSENHCKISWSKKLKVMKQSSLALKLKASKDYLKSLFTKSQCSEEETSTEVSRNGDVGVTLKAKQSLNKYMNMAKKNPFGQIHKERYRVAANSIGGSSEKEKMNEGNCVHRRSFSLSMKKHSATNSSYFSSSSLSGSSSSSSTNSSLSSANSTGFQEVHVLKRSSSANSEIETSVQGAIAYCKQSQQVLSSRKNSSEVGFCSLSAARIAACEDQGRPGLCRGW